MPFSISSQGEKTVLFVAGDLTIEQAPEFKNQLTECQERDLIIDLTEASAIDASGIQLVLAASIAWPKTEKKFAVRGLPDFLCNAVRLSGIVVESSNC